MRRLLNWRTIAGIVAPRPGALLPAALFYYLLSAEETLAQKECNDRVMRFLYLGEQLPRSQVHKRWDIIGVYCEVMRAFFHRKKTSVAQ